MVYMILRTCLAILSSWRAGRQGHRTFPIICGATDIEYPFHHTRREDLTLYDSDRHPIFSRPFIPLGLSPIYPSD